VVSDAHQYQSGNLLDHVNATERISGP